MLDETSDLGLRGLQRLRAGGKAYGRVVRLLEFEGATEELHGELRSALQTLRNAMDWLESEDGSEKLFEQAHHLLDAAGRLARESFPHGCQLAFENKLYHQKCPVALAHNRVGVSPEIKIHSMKCSICDADPDDCDHIRGQEYDGKRCIHVIGDIEFMGAAFVGIPAQPDARFLSVTISPSELQAQHGEKFYTGMPITCNNCLFACDGLRYPFTSNAAEDAV